MNTLVFRFLILTWKVLKTNYSKGWRRLAPSAIDILEKFSLNFSIRLTQRRALLKSLLISWKAPGTGFQYYGRGSLVKIFLSTNQHLTQEYHSWWVWGFAARASSSAIKLLRTYHVQLERKGEGRHCSVWEVRGAHEMKLKDFKSRFKKKWGTPTCSLVCPTFGISPSRLAMFTLAPCWIRSFTIWSMSRPLAVWSGVFPANVTLLTSAPRVIKYSTTWFFPASTAWCKAVRPLLESWEMLRVISYQVLLFNRVI